MSPISLCAVEVAILRWPAEEGCRKQLAERGTPRLLLVEADRLPPPTDCMEDWVDATAGEDEIRARVSALEERWRIHNPAMPELDANGLLRFRGAWVALTPVESRLAKLLLDRMGTVVGREAIIRAGWRDDEPARNVLDVHILRLRRRLAPLGLGIKTFRGRGYLMEEEEIPQ